MQKHRASFRLHPKRIKDWQWWVLSVGEIHYLLNTFLGY